MLKYLKISTFVALILSFLFATNMNAQTRVVTVEQGVGTLNDAIDGDTTATGERNDPENTVYELKRSAYYLTTGTIANSGWPLRIRAVEGEGERPIIMPAYIEGGESSYPFRPRGDFYISGLYITNMDNSGKLLDRPIRATADSIRIVVDDCHIDYAAQAAFRIDNDWNKIFITNSIISNMGRMGSPDNGRGIDDRGKNIDTLVMQNNTFYNITMTVIRDGGGIINYCKVDNNTLANIGQYGIHIGEAIEAYFTNNVVINAGFLGGTDDRGVVKIDPIGEDLVNQGVQQLVVVTNNNFYTDPSLIAAHPDTIGVVPTFDSETAALIEAQSTGLNNIEEALQFTSSPALPLDVIASYYNAAIEPEQKTDMDDGEGGPRFNENFDFLGVLVQMPFDFGYPTSTASFSAGTNAQPLGDLTWFEGVTAVDDVETLPVAYELYNNYPNPFNPTTTIKYSIPEQANVKLTIFNTIGQEVATLINTAQNAGSYSFTWNGKNDAGVKVSSGIYLYHLKAGNFVSTKKMIMLK